VTSDSIAFIDLKAQRDRIRDRLDVAIGRVLDHGSFIMGPEIAELERRLAEFCGVRHAITCSSGTDALLLPLMAKGIGRGSAVFVPAFTFVAAAEVSAVLGATPFFVDVLPDTFNMDPESLAGSISAAREMGLDPAAVVPVDLYGQTADYRALAPVAEEHGLFVIEDAAQSFGATLDGARAGSFGNVAGTSFFPAKPLGCYGDGGAIFTNDGALADAIRQVRVHGQGDAKYQYRSIGVNGRLDTVQAAVLIEKLAIFPDEIEARQRVAERYDRGLGDIATVPMVAEGMRSVWAQYTLKVDDRDGLVERLRAEGVPTAIHYPLPLTEQPAYGDFPVAPSGVPVSEALSRQVLSLPMHPYLDEPTQDRIIDAVRRCVSWSGGETKN
jgi:dTDP-4-amino-4,6-dideoxygalactose transaminase